MSGILAELGVEGAKCALLVVDMVRGYFDPQHAYAPLEKEDAARVTKGVQALLGVFRSQGLPVIYTQNFGRRTAWGPVDKLNPFLRWQEENKRKVAGAKFTRKTSLNTEGSPYAGIHDAVGPREGEIVVHKLRYDSFYCTHLETILRSLKTENLFLCGVNTNNCVLATAYGAFCRDFRVFLVEDACATWNGPDLHRAAVSQVAASLGWVIGCAEATGHLGAKAQAQGGTR